MISAPPQIPSYSQGFARRGESANTHLWTDLQLAVHAPLGPTGEKWFDQSGYGRDGTLTNMDPASDWVMTEKGWALDFITDDVVLATAPLTGPPFTMVALARSTNIVNWQNVISLVNSNTNADYFGLAFPGNVAGDPFRYAVRDVSGSSNLEGSQYVSGRWYSLCAVERAVNDRELYVDGVSIATSNVSLAPSNINVLSIGRLERASPSAALRGQVAFAAVYNRALTPAEIMQLYLDPAALFRYPHHYRCLDGLPAVSDRVGRGILTGGRM